MQVSDKIDINDRLVRIIGIQFFGIVIPNATGLISNNDRSVYYLIGAYAYFILIAFLIWQGNRVILFKLEERYNWFINPAQKVIMILGGNVFYTAPLVVVMLLGWYWVSGNPADWTVIQITAVVCVICVIFITHAYETVILIKQRESDKVMGEKLERAKVQAELEALKNQIDPHFMFNSLNNLAHLIDNNPEKAREFTENLAEVYRYILSNKESKLVILEDELLFLNKYIALLHLRFEDSLKIDFNLEDQDKAAFLIPPISIFFALENVVKHNEISNRFPMAVEIGKKDHVLYITNPVKEKKKKYHSTKVGLVNLDERFKIVVGTGIQTEMENNQFKLQLPMLPLAG
ncbi:MAG: histidine kinase [Bacteroidota bacterium]